MYALKFNENDLNVVVNALANLPYGQVYGLIDSIQKQVQQQQMSAETTVTDSVPSE